MQKQHDNVIVELTVRNHPGVMTHVCGLFARRAFNVEGILCLPIQGSEQSRIWPNQLSALVMRRHKSYRIAASRQVHAPLRPAGQYHGVIQGIDALCYIFIVQLFDNMKKPKTLPLLSIYPRADIQRPLRCYRYA